MSSKQTDLADRAERSRQVDQALADDRRGRDRLRNLADQPPPSHDDGRRDTPNTYPGRQR